ncbi:choline dehydrogenase [Fluviicoccus keumensis]|uniref:Choline dehydrogenase n=1 Tax=Fluviicoccus keumensis TaxID=1435465 RepID=A0A4Q7Z8C3_9GAMM|nr:GMC family oxidoreductase [Fluviicoccus keumensis]RZU46757.1 choline dehydrogenase [Fluviicoccus keumensis]
MAFDDIYTKGIANGWKVTDSSTLTQDRVIETDVVIIGSGAGGGTTAEILTQAGLNVVILEEGPLKTSASFKDMDEGRAYRELYQEGAGRATGDGAIAILQGRAVGGTTVVNWTASFRTPSHTLKHWADVHDVKGHSPEEMAPWFEKMEKRLNIAPWSMPPNENNTVLQTGAQKLGWEWHVIPRNVNGCWNSGYCGMGCPANAKQSMLVSTIPAALAGGATLLHKLHVARLLITGGKVTGVEAMALDTDARKPTGIKVSVKAKHYILSAGAINSPALLLRSKAPDPHERLGKRTCIHPVVLSMAHMPQPTNPFYGAPQSIASDFFQWKDGATGPIGYKLEVPPMYPGIASGIFGTFGNTLMDEMAKLPNTNAMLALMRDGFVEDSQGGVVRISDKGDPILDYDVTDALWNGAKRAYLSMAEAQFAGGASEVKMAHLDSAWVKTWKEAQTQINQLSYKKFRTALFTAHLMGGCTMSEDAKKGVVNSRGRHHQLENLSVFDGSVFPTSIGANPQLSIYGLVAQNATALATELGGKPV